MTLRVDAPRLSEPDDLLSLSAAVACDRWPAAVPGMLHFSVAADGGLRLGTRADPFLVGLLPLAMRLGVPLRIEGVVSLRLAYGAEAYQDILTRWWPDTFQRVPVRIEEVDPRDDDRRPAGVGCCFSGGIDSFSALQELRAPRMAFPALRVTHAIMVNGFDQIVDPERTGVARRMEDAYRRILGPWDVDLVMVHSNLKAFRDALFTRTELTRSFGSPLTACGHALAPGLGRFHLSGHATYAYADLVPEGAHPVLDHHLSSDQLEVRHTGARLARVAKLEALLDEVAAQEGLRVCSEEPTFDPGTGRPLNCGSCLKCVVAIATLDLLDALDAFPTFAIREPLEAYRDPRRFVRASLWSLRDLQALADRRGRRDWARVLRKAIARKR